MGGKLFDRPSLIALLILLILKQLFAQGHPGMCNLLDGLVALGCMF